MVGAYARLARRQPPELRRSRRRRAHFSSGLSGRRAMDRRRSREDLVRAGEVAAVVPPDPGRDAVGTPTVANLRRPRLLSDPAALKAALGRAARAHGFDVVGVTRPDAIPRAAQHLREFLAAGAHGDRDWMMPPDERRGEPRALC